jgi:nucleoside-diphosphate-sugar epimerase
VLRGDITERHCGLSPQNLATLIGAIDVLVHCAASIGFTDEKVAMETNVTGLLNVLELMHRLQIHDLRHVSTAYVAGDSEFFAETDLIRGQTLRNPYERSKWTGEAMLHAWQGGTYSIYRPSILVGREDGSTPTLDGYYGFFRPIHLVAQSLRSSRARQRELPPDIAVGEDGTVSFPLALHASFTSKLNLVPIDWAAEMMARLLNLPSSKKTYHLTHPEPPFVANVIKDSLRTLGVQGWRIVETLEELTTIRRTHSPLTLKLEGQINRVLDHYVPYVTRQPTFDITNIRTDLGHRYEHPSPMDERFLARLLTFAVSQWNASKEAHA